MTENICTKQVVLKDLQKLQKISRTTFLEAFEADNNPEDMATYISESFSLEHLKSEILNPESQFFFLEVEEKLAGYLKLNWGKAQTEQKLEDALEIERIYLLSEYYGRGIGQILYAKALEIAYSHDLKRIWLGVWEENYQAVKFYRKNGFEPFDTHIFKLGTDEQTDLLMKREIEVRGEKREAR